jgi:hypothetical protein
MFCGVCEKEVEIRRKVSKPKFWYITKWKIYHTKDYNDKLVYERYVCCKCGSELLIEEGNYVNSKCKGSGT